MTSCIFMATRPRRPTTILSRLGLSVRGGMQSMTVTAPSEVR